MENQCRRGEEANSGDKKRVILTLQLCIAELSAGMLDEAGLFAGGAAKEIEEETGLQVPANELITMTQLALSRSTSDDEENLQHRIYPSLGMW